ncbi:MAG: hypothetical protein WCX71_01105 [Candidatus Buchananbacteria bacterium]
MRLDFENFTFPWDLPAIDQRVLVVMSYWLGQCQKNHRFEANVLSRGQNENRGWYIILSQPGAPFTSQLELYLSNIGNGYWHLGQNSQTWLSAPISVLIDVYLFSPELDQSNPWRRFKPSWNKVTTKPGSFWSPPPMMPDIGQRVMLYLSAGDADYNLEAQVQGRGQNDYYHWYFVVAQPGAPFTRPVVIYYDQDRWHLGLECDQHLFNAKLIDEVEVLLPPDSNK